MSLQEQVQAVLKKVRVHLQSHTEDGTVQVRLKGACQGCPMAQQTLSLGIERTLKEEIPQVTAVEAVD